MAGRKRILLLLPTLVITSLVFAQQVEFSRSDSLQGMLTFYRTCYDVRFYHLDVRIDPGDSTIAGSNTIQFNVVQPFDTMQIDLFKNLDIERIEFEGGGVPFAREENAVFVAFPHTMLPGEQQNIIVRFRGKPTIAGRPPWNGGFSWVRDAEGNPWVVVTCQGEGASLWWPNKDHQSDEPDSMLISVTVPPGLEDISNGRLRSKMPMNDGWTRYNWFVANPINNYDVTINIGKYAYFGDSYRSGKGDVLTLDYYVMPQNLEKAKEQFRVVKPMMACFEQHFGKYPFYEDGYKLVECPHTGMEHQSAVAYGNWYINGYRGRAPAEVGLKFDFIIVHESAHEWWGNSITAEDVADMWIHESFGAYAEAIFVECRYGRDESLRYINGKKPNIDHTAPIIGVYNVHHSGSHDMYNKGQLVLNTLRSVVDNDSLWFAILLGMGESFRHTIVTAEDVFGYINNATGKDLGYFFEQYLKRLAIPELEAIVTKQEDSVRVRYRWNADVRDFHMPVKVTVADSTYDFIYPTTSWQTSTLGDVDPQHFGVAEDLFYVNSKISWVYLDPRLRK